MCALCRKLLWEKWLRFEYFMSFKKDLVEFVYLITSLMNFQTTWIVEPINRTFSNESLRFGMFTNNSGQHYSLLTCSPHNNTDSSAEPDNCDPDMHKVTDYQEEIRRKFRNYEV